MQALAVDPLRQRLMLEAVVFAGGIIRPLTLL